MTAFWCSRAASGTTPSRCAYRSKEAADTRLADVKGTASKTATYRQRRQTVSANNDYCCASRHRPRSANSRAEDAGSPAAQYRPVPARGKGTLHRIEPARARLILTMPASDAPLRLTGVDLVFAKTSTPRWESLPANMRRPLVSWLATSRWCCWRRHSGSVHQCC